MPRKKYRIIGLPEKLFLRCQKIVESSVFGYTSISELVKDGTRRRLEEIEKHIIQVFPEGEQEASTNL